MQFGIVYLKDFNKIVLIMDAPENKQGALKGKSGIILFFIEARMPRMQGLCGRGQARRLISWKAVFTGIFEWL